MEISNSCYGGHLWTHSSKFVEKTTVQCLVTVSILNLWFELIHWIDLCVNVWAFLEIAVVCVWMRKQTVPHWLICTFKEISTLIQCDWTHWILPIEMALCCPVIQLTVSIRIDWDGYFAGNSIEAVWIVFSVYFDYLSIQCDWKRTKKFTSAKVLVLFHHTMYVALVNIKGT